MSKDSPMWELYTSIEQRVLAGIGLPEVMPLVHRILRRCADVFVLVVRIHGGDWTVCSVDGVRVSRCIR